jgi:phage FluMu protein Com
MLRDVDHIPLLEFRCACGKLLFKAVLYFACIEIKCRGCAVVTVFSSSQNGEYPEDKEDKKEKRADLYDPPP